MITSIISKLPYIDKEKSLDFYLQGLNFLLAADFGDYLILKKENLEIHLFEFTNLEPSESDFMIYLRTTEISNIYNELQSKGISIHPNGKLETKPWGQREFSIIDPSGTLLTFGEAD